MTLWKYEVDFLYHMVNKRKGHINFVEVTYGVVWELHPALT